MITQTDKTILSKLSLRARTTLEALLSSGAAEKAVAEVEADQLSKRKLLAAELAKVISQPPSNAMELQSRQAFERLTQAEAAVREARAQYHSLSMQAGHAHDMHAAEIRKLEQALVASADPRLAEFIFQLVHIRDAQLPGALNFWIDRTRRDAFVPIGTNAELIERACEAINDAVERTRTLQLQAKSFVEVGQALAAMCADLSAPLAAVELNPPSLTAAESEPGAPLRWNGLSQWIVDEHVAVKEPTATKPVRKSRTAA